MRTIPALTVDGLAAAPWALDRAYLAQLLAYAQRGEPVAAAPRQATPAPNRGAVAVIPIHGVIEHRSSFMLELFGGTSVEDVRGMLRAALADQQIGSIVLDIDSPGGGVAGITELAADIRAARAVKRVIAIANTTAASAAYWLGSQASQLLVTPSGQAGSVGIYAIHYDESRALDAIGVTATIISAGDHKVDGNPYEPLSDDARSEMQRRVDAYYGQFLADVAKGRGVTVDKVKADFGQGRVLLAREALAAGMVDGIDTLDNAMRLSTRPLSANRAETDGPDPEEYELPFRARTEALAEEAEALVEHATVRANLRAKEGRRAFGEPTQNALRSIRDAISALLADEPPVAAAPAAQTVEPTAPVVPTSPAVPVPSRFRSDADWQRYLQERTH